MGREKPYLSLIEVKYQYGKLSSKFIIQPTNGKNFNPALVDRIILN